MVGGREGGRKKRREGGRKEGRIDGRTEGWKEERKEGRIEGWKEGSSSTTRNPSGERTPKLPF
jgi:hypothetical protein